MAKVSLRVYNREIESMIEGGQVDEAIAQCMNILKTFSMHVETYRLLGKAFLEARRYGDATDIFRRVLMAVPDDFVAHVGMSIIRDDEGKLDEAIWHMERAFAVQPSNPAIQGELRRLYGRRDGVEPPKIRLSRDALANMYSQGELFNQSVAEIRAVLAEEPQRPDLEVMLARAYFRSGQKVEAAELANHLLNRYSYCMDALRILVEVLPGTARAENTQVYRQRLRMLDPYSSFVTGSVFESDQVADAAINLERLEYNPSALPAAGPQSDWAASLGIKLEDAHQENAPPDWMTGQAAGEPGSTPELSQSEAAVSEAAAPAAEGEIPDWMRSAGWQPSAGAAEETPVAFDEPESAAEGPIAQAEIPDWLKAMAPAAALDEGATPSPGTPQVSESDESTPLGEGLPDWLGSLDEPAGEATGTGQPQTEVAASAPERAVTVPDEGLSNLLGSLGLPAADQPAPEAAPAEELPDWLQQIGSADPGPAQPAAQAAWPKEEPVLDDSQRSPRQDDSMMDDAAPLGPTGPSRPLGIEDDAMAWLESLAAKQGAKPEELLTKPEDRGDETPESVQRLSGAMAPGLSPSAQPEEPLPVPAAQAADLLDEDVPLGPTGPAQPLGIEDDTMAWLEGLAAKQGAKAEELLTKPEDRGDGTPESVQRLAAEAEDQPGPAGPPPVEAAPGPSLEEAFPDLPEVEAPAVAEDVSLTSWLEKLAVADEREPAPTAQTVESASILPDLGQEDVTPAAEEELPEWLRGLERPTDEAGTAPPAEAESLPEWLRQDMAANLPAAEGAPKVEDAALPTELTAGEPGLPPGRQTETVRKPPIAEPAAAIPQGKADEEELPSWMLDETAPVEPGATPTEASEWVPAAASEGVRSAPTSAQPGPPAPDTAPAPPPSRAVGELARVPQQDKESDTLAGAQTTLERGDLALAMEEYARLIKRGRLLDEVIYDLREAIYRFPVDVIVWQTLGDAYMRANRLQEALDSYTKAEELLR
ncbi:MAG: hypothetical protein JXB85_08840 [Anaerolineales bacterium]|nr:hypothetical protein [Anaerolineales bacterium]